MPVLTEKTQDANLHMWACPDAKAAVAVDAASHRLAFMTLPGFDSDHTNFHTLVHSRYTTPPRCTSRLRW
jgi:hypothetical protein